MANKITQTGSPKDFVDHSYFYKPYMIPAVLGFILWAAYVCWTGYWGIVHGRVPVIDIGMQIAILWWLLDTVLTKTVYRLEDDGLYMLKTGVGHKKEIIIPYDEIYGVHHFKNQLMKPVTYRYTFHEYAKMDNRPIWSLLYDIGSTQKVGRVLMKASEEFWKEFEKRMPGQIRIPQEEVVTFTYKGMEKKLREQAEEEKMNNLPSDTQENGQKVHHIKLGAAFFEEVASGEKTFELRKNDRDYKKGDILEMMEFKDGKNTGRTVRVLVTYILEEFAGLEDGYCIMATSLLNENGEPFDRADIKICADIRANGDGYVEGGEEYIMIENAVGIIAGGKEE